MRRRRVFDQVPKALIKRIGGKVGTMVTTTVRVIMSKMETITATITSTGVTMNGGDSMVRVEYMLHKMMRRFNASDENIKELRCDLASIGQKFDTHAISIKQIKLQMAQLSATVNTQQLGTLPSNTVQNPKNDAHCMAISTRGGNQTIDRPMPSKEVKVIKDNNKVVEGSGKVEDNTG